MRNFLKRLLLFLGIFGLLLIATGCGDKKDGDGGGGGLKDTEIKQAITARIKSFRTAVEAYDVEGMLDFLHNTGSNEQLIIAEGGVGAYSYNKDYATLENELRQDAGKQLHWRKSPAEGGYGYTLTMELEEIIYNKLSAGGADAVVYFTIIEAAQEPFIEPTITDTGHMACEMVKLQGTWRCQKMTIVFYSSDKSPSGGLNSTLSASHNLKHNSKNSTGKTRGFSLGRFNFE